MTRPPKAPVRRPAWDAAAPALLSLASLLLAGCNIVGPALYLAHGPEQVEPLYELDKTKPVIVFVDDRGSRLPNRSLRRSISQAAEQRLLTEKGVGELVSSQGIATVTARERFSKPMGIAQIGKELGAKIVIYATIDSFALSPDGANFNPAATLRVKVVDAETEARLWPPVGGDDEWHTLDVSVAQGVGYVPKDVGELNRTEHALADEVGLQLGNIFVTHFAQKSKIRGEN